MKPQIFSLHFSGGNAYSFKNLFADLKGSFSVELLELPGRGKRLDEELLFTREEAVADLLHQIRVRRENVPYVIYGHSMGAELGFIVSRELERMDDPPVCFIPSGNAGPNVHKREKLAGLPRERFFAKLKEIGGINEELLQNEELMDFFEPILRADFGLLERAEETFIDYKINTPIYAIMGDAEKYASQIRNWQNYTSGNFAFRILEGDHFFIYRHADVLKKVISNSFSD